MIGINDYTEMEVLVNGAWVKADVLKVLENGMALYIVGEKNFAGTYSMGACAPAQECRAIEAKPTTETRVKNAIDIMGILQAEGFEIDSDGDWMPTKDNGVYFGVAMWASCGSTPDSDHSYRSEWLEEVEL